VLESCARRSPAVHDRAQREFSTAAPGSRRDNDRQALTALPAVIEGGNQTSGPNREFEHRELTEIFFNAALQPQD